MDNKKIGAFIAYHRKKQGLTQEQLGERLHVSNKTISRWENGNYMPDISLLKPLSDELKVSVNELLSGETIEEEKTADYYEHNLINTLDYSNRKIKNEHAIASFFLAIIGIVCCLSAFTDNTASNHWHAILSIIGLSLIIIAIFRELPIISLFKKRMIAISCFLALFIICIYLDFLSVIQLKRVPIYYRSITTKEHITDYQALFYHVFQINADTPYEYFIIDTTNQYTLDTLPVFPFNKEKSGIEQLLKLKSPYIGDNSNTGNLIASLPLAEHGYTFEIDDVQNGLIISYLSTDWYGNDDQWIEKALIYNSVSAFSLIDNLQYIQFHFSGSSYYISRKVIEQQYPYFDQINNGQELSIPIFEQTVEQAINDTSFVNDIFSLFEKNK